MDIAHLHFLVAEADKAQRAATVEGETMHLRAMVATPDGKRSAHAELTGAAGHPELLGERVSELLGQQDAHAILEACRQDAAPDA